MKDDDQRREADVVPLFAEHTRGDVFDRLGAVERRLSSIEALIEQGFKDITTAVGVKWGRSLDTEERVTALEREGVKVRAEFEKLNQAATKRLTAGKKRK